MSPTVVLLASLCSSPALAVAQEAEPPTAPNTEPVHNNGVSARVLSGRTWLDVDSAPLLGIGVALEHEFLDGDIIIELAGEWLHDPGRNAALMELVAEHGFDLTEHTLVAIGAGPLFALALEEQPGWGAVAVVALETELSPRLELFVEFDAAVVFAPTAVLETDLGTGVMWKF